MYTKRILICIACWFHLSAIHAQVPVSEMEADVKSLELYNAGQWKELLTYVRTAIDADIDFPLLRMRAGYSAFMLGDFSQSLLQYKNALRQDPGNEISIYYCYLNNVYLNNIAGARYYVSKMSEEARQTNKISSVKLANLQAEYSYKIPGDSSRKNAQYFRAGANVQLGLKTTLDISGAFYNQAISEPKFSAVRNNTHINVNQKEGYGKLTIAATGDLSVIGAYHYLYTPFNNLIYNNNIGFFGLKYNMTYANVQAAANLGNIGDSSLHQYDATVTVFPFGNLKLYTVSRLSFGKSVNFSQVAGVYLFKGAWLEGNVVIGSYKTLLEDDALYVYNDIDTKRMRAGATLYLTLVQKLSASLTYTYERKLRIFTINNFYNQQSISGGLTWNF